MIFDRAAFYSAIRPLFGGHLETGQVDGLNRILSGYEAVAPADLRYPAYALATVKWETANTMQPIVEIGHGEGHPYAIGGYYGRGLVQLTWDYNYRLWQNRLNLPLLTQPELVLTWPVALPILIGGMATGAFTGHRLADYFSYRLNDPLNARRIINGTDHAADIEAYYTAFLAALNRSKPK